jgi:hypothetical protein
MSTGLTTNYSLPYPLSTDPVNVASDIQDLSSVLDNFLLNPAFINGISINNATLSTTNLSANIFDTNSTTLNIGGAATIVNIGATSGQVDFRGDVNIATGRSYEINNVSVLTSTTLGSSIVGSSLTSLGTVTTGTWNATTIAVNTGGTGLTSYATGDILFSSGETTLEKLSDVATGNSLISGGVGVAPSWGKIGLTTHVSGTLTVANGGTGVTLSTGSTSVVLSSSPTLTGIPLSTTAATDTNTTQIATTAYIIGQAGSLDPIVNGTAGVGTSLRYSRQDHVHGTDITRAPLNSPIFTGNVSLNGTVFKMNADASVGESVSLVVERGSEADVEIRWNEVGDAWQFTNDGTTYFDIPTAAGGGSGLEAVLMFAGM